MSTTKKYRFESLNERNIHHLITLYKQVFGTNYSLEFIKAKYQNDYTSINAQGHFAFMNEKPVAFHGAIPVIMHQNGKRELCAQYGDAMTLKSHAGNGLFTILGQKTDQLLKELEVKFAWGFPNQNSEYGYVNKLAWKGKARMQCYIIKINSYSTEQLFRKTKIFSKQNQNRINQKLEGITAEKVNLNSIKNETLGGIERSKAFYDYKRFTPNFFIHLNGTKVWVKPQGGLLVGDIEIQSEKQLLETIDSLKDLANTLGLHQLILQASPKSELNQLLKKHYTAIDSWLIGYKNFNSELDLSQLQFTYGDLDTF